MNRGLDLRLGIADELDEVHAHGALSVVFGEVLPDGVPDHVVLREAEHLGIDGLDRGRAEPDQLLGIAQGGIEAAIAHIDQSAVFGDRHHVQLGFGDQEQACLRCRRGSSSG